MHTILEINYLDYHYEITNELIGLYSIMTGDTSNNTFNVNSTGTFFEVDSSFHTSSQTNDNILITVFDSSGATVSTSVLEQPAYLNYYTIIKNIDSNIIETGNIPLHIYNNLSDYKYIVRNLKYAGPGLQSFVDYINVSPFKDILTAYIVSGEIYIKAVSDYKYIDYSLLDFTLSEISGVTTNTSAFTYQTDNQYATYNLNDAITNIFDPNPAPINLYNENYIYANEYYIEEIYDTTNNTDYPGGSGTWYPIQSSRYKITPIDKNTLLNFKKYTYVDFGILERDTISYDYDYYSGGNLLQSSVTFDTNVTPYVITDSGRTMITEINDDYFIIEKPFLDNSVSGLTGGTGTSQGLIGIYDLINVAKTIDISDILMKVYINQDDNYYHIKSDSERFEVYSAYGQIISKNEIIQQNTTGLIYQDENNLFNFDIYNSNDINLTYTPIEIFKLGVDKKTILPIPISIENISIEEDEDEWFLTGGVNYESDESIILHDSIIVNSEIFSMIEVINILPMVGINIKLNFDQDTIFELKLKENHDFDSEIFWGDTTGSTTLNYSGVTASAITHEYAAGNYVLSIPGIFEALDFENDTYIKKVLSWGDSGTTQLKYISFDNCINLISLPEESERLKAVTSFDYVFRNTKISSIPKYIFNGNTNLLSFNYAFSGCKELTSIDNNIINALNINNLIGTFKDCINIINLPRITTTNIVSFESAFENCQKIINDNNLVIYTAAISCESMFKDCTSLISNTNTNTFTFAYNVTTYESAFENCSSLTSVSTFNSFYPISFNATNFESIYKNCSAITILPSDLFLIVTGATTFESSFEGCSSLITIPSNLFTTITGVTTFESTFKDCSTITNVDNIFSSNLIVTTFESTFKNCTSLLTVNSDLFINRNSVTTYKSTFENCTSLMAANSFSSECDDNIIFDSTYINCTQLNTIPEYIFSGLTAVEEFSHTFENCALTRLLDQIFIDNIAVLSFDSTFKNNSISQLTLLFDGLIYAENFNSTFENNILRNIPINLFDSNINARLFNNTFSSNNTLSGAAPMLWDYNIWGNVSQFIDCFSDCGKLGTSATTIPITWGGVCTNSDLLTCTGQ